MWVIPGLIFLVMALATKLSTAQDSRLDHAFSETENAGLEVMQENPCPKGCLPEKRARSIGAGGPLLDVLSRRSALDKNFMRFGRTPPETSAPRDENVYRASRAKNTNFIRLGRGKSDNFMRFGRRDDFMRFGRRDDFLRFGRRDDFLRFGRAGGKVVRLGPANGYHFRDDFVRFGRSPDEDVSEEDLNEDAAVAAPQDQELGEDDRRWKRNARH